MKDKETRFNNIKSTIISIGTGAMIGNAAFGIWDRVNANLDCKEAIITIGCVSLLVTGLTLIQQNPYANKKMIKEEEKEISEFDSVDEFDEIELEEQPKVKKLQK